MAYFEEQAIAFLLNFPISFNLNSAGGRVGVCGSNVHGKAQRRGMVPSAGRYDPAAGCGRLETRSRPSPMLPDPRFAGPFVRRPRAIHSKELQRSRVPRKPFNPSRRRTHPEDESQAKRKVFVDYAINLRNERSTAGFRANPRW